MTETAQPPIIFTDNAAKRVAFLLEDETNKQLKLRVYVTGGGCSGFQYGFVLDDKISDDDTIVYNNDVGLLVDALSYQYLVNAAVEFEEGLNGVRFLVKNPNASSNCSCGASFSID